MAPSMWEQRRARIARQQREKVARKQAQRQQPDDDRDDDDTPPRARRTLRSGKPSAIVSRDRLRTQRGGIERTMAWLVLLLSFLGSIAALHGGFTPLIASIRAREPNVAALLGGILIQLIVTALEWYYFDRPLIAWSARVVDTATTAIGYGPLLLMPLATLLYTRGIDNPIPPAWGIIIVASLGIAWFPESRLVD